MIKKTIDENNSEVMELGGEATNIKNEIDEKIYNRKTSTILKRLLISIPVVLGGLILVALAYTEGHERFGMYIGVAIIVALSIIWRFKTSFTDLPDSKFYKPKEDIILNK